MIVRRLHAVRVVLAAVVALTGSAYLLHGQDLGPKLYFRVTGNQLDLGVDTNVTIHLRAADGKATKTIEARPDGSCQWTAFNKDGRRMYQVQDSVDGSAQIVMFETEKDKVAVKMGKDGTIDFKVLPLPKEPKETRSAEATPTAAPASTKAVASDETKPIGEASSVLKK